VYPATWNAVTMWMDSLANSGVVTAARFEDAELVAPIAMLLRIWREFRQDDIQQTAIELQKAGYKLNWVTRS
jgi:hypothetical protein